MIDWIPIALNFGVPGAGCFVGTYAAFFTYCPNKRCCQQKRVNAICEGLKENEG